jgi:hypothetical protein
LLHRCHCGGCRASCRNTLDRSRSTPQCNDCCQCHPSVGATSLVEQNAPCQTIRRLNRAFECNTQCRHILGTTNSISAGSRVEFFNATDIFLRVDGQYVNATSMSPDMLHPSPAGYNRPWGSAIVDHVQSILATESKVNCG